MDSSELHRKLLYCGYSDLAEYLKDSPTNRYIYNLLLDLQSNHNMEVPVLTIFNEIYYQCVRIQSDGNPGEDVSRRYLDEEEIQLGRNSGRVNLLVFCLVAAIIKRKTNLSFNEECFLKQLEPLIAGCEYKHVADSLTNFMVSNNIYSPYEFKTKPCPINEIPMRIDIEYRTKLSFWERVRRFFSLPIESSEVDFNPWRKVTDGFYESTIMWYVDQYLTREDQLRLLERIKRACTKTELAARQNFFDKLDLFIRNGRYVNNSKSYSKTTGDFVFTSDERILAYSRLKEYETQINELIQQCEELRNNHKLELAGIEAKYQAEIAALKKQLVTEEKASVNESQASTESGVKSLSVSEMVAYVKDCFNESAANSFCNMFYSLATKHGNLDEEASRLIDSIIPTIKHRDTPHQTFDIHDPHQVNFNSEVENKYQ